MPLPTPHSPLPNITVITVCRNAVTTIGQTIRSVMAQDYPHLRYIIIDGASTDGTQQIIEGYKTSLVARHSTLDFIYLSEPDAGIYDAMNKGLRLAGEGWVNFMNAGDTFASDHVLSDIFGELSIINSQLSINHRVIGGNTINFFADGHEEVHHAEPAEVIPERLPFSHQASFVRIDQEPLQFDQTYRMAADYKMFYDIYEAHGPEAFLVLDLPIARYRQEDSLTMNPANQRRLKGEYLRVQSAHRSWRWWKEYLKWRLL